MSGLIVISVSVASVIVLVVYGVKAEFNVLQGRHISHTQREVITGLGVAVLIIVYALWQWSNRSYWYDDDLAQSEIDLISNLPGDNR